MFKLIVSLAFLAVCSATLWDNKEADYHINVGRDHVIVSNGYGYQVHFTLDRYNQILVHVMGQGQVLDTERIVNEPVTVDGKYEADILYQIFDNFSGIVDEVTYEKLLHIIEQYVQEGRVHPIVFYTLQMLLHQQHNLRMLTPYHQQYYNSAYDMFNRVGYTQLPYNKLGLWQRHGDYQRDYTGQYKNWYGVGRQGLYYPEVYGQDWTRQTSYGPYNRNVWNRQTFSGLYNRNLWNSQNQGYGQQYGFGFGMNRQFPYGGIWSQWRMNVPYQTQLLLN